MKKEEFAAAMQRIQEEIHTLKQEREQIKELWVKENAEFEIGERVKVVRSASSRKTKIGGQDVEFKSSRSQRFAFISSYLVGDDGKIYYRVKREKSNGEATKIEYTLNANERIVKIKQ